MNKAELVNAVADRTGEPKAKVGESIDAVFDAITAALKSGNDVRLPNFGVFDVKDTAERIARNPQTGQEVKVPAGKKARFKPGKALKEALGGEEDED
ncbi:MAG: HU family DNA-binding protein [Caulobacterales bacterium]